jgi:hypothetical protein
MIFMTFISMHSVIMCVVLPWRTYEMHPDLSFKSGCDIARRSGLHVQGSDTFPWGSRPTVGILEYIVLPGHVATPEPSTWWSRVLFTTRLEVAARV